MSSEHRNRTNKAQAIAAAIVTVGMTSDTARQMSAESWALAAGAGWYIAKAEGVEGIAAEPWTTVSAATRREVFRLLAADEAKARDDAEGLTAHRTDDVFANIAAGSALPQPVQDPDAAPSSGQLLSIMLNTGLSEAECRQVYAEQHQPGSVPCGTCGAPLADGDAGAYWHADGTSAAHQPPTGWPHGFTAAQDPDRAPRVSAAGVVDLHPAARHTLNCLATSGGRTGCAC